MVNRSVKVTSNWALKVTTAHHSLLYKGGVTERQCNPIFQRQLHLKGSVKRNVFRG